MNEQKISHLSQNELEALIYAAINLYLKKIKTSISMLGLDVNLGRQMIHRTDSVKDSQRLDYLEKNYGRTISLQHGDWCSHPERKPYQAVIEAITHPNLRSAIDFCLADAILNPAPALTTQDIFRLFRIPPDFFKCSCPSGNGSLRPWPCPVHPPEAPKAAEENTTYLHARYSIEGTVIFKREKESSEKRCTCCPDSTSHIYNRHIRWDSGGRTDDMPLLEQITKRTDSEGKRVKLTLEVIAEPF